MISTSSPPRAHPQPPIFTDKKHLYLTILLPPSYSRRRAGPWLIWCRNVKKKITSGTTGHREDSVTIEDHHDISPLRGHGAR
jgi:hypothetical protein